MQGQCLKERGKLPGKFLFVARVPAADVDMGRTVSGSDKYGDAALVHIEQRAQPEQHREHAQNDHREARVIADLNAGE